jgi:hypothetical protein
MYHPTIMFRREPVQDVGMYSMPYSEDYDLFWKISTRYKIANLAQVLLHYRLSSSSLNTVLKKTDYDIANEQNVLRNLRYYLGNGFTISKPVLECLRHNFKPVLNAGDLHQVKTALNVVDSIAEIMLAKENPNSSIEAIRAAQYYKRRFILTEVSRKLPKHKALYTLISLGEWHLLFELLERAMKWRMLKMRSLIFGFLPNIKRGSYGY